MSGAIETDPIEVISPLAGRPIDAPFNSAQKTRLQILWPEAAGESSVAGDPIIAQWTDSREDNALIGGLKVTTPKGWFAARPSGTESVYKIYAESFESESHLNTILSQAQKIVCDALKSPEVRK